LNKTDFKTLFLDNFQLLTQKAFYIVRNNEAAEDIVQDVFYRFWQKRDELTVNSPKAYLMRSVINTCLNYLDKHKRMVLTPHEELPARMKNDTAETIAFNELNTRLRAALEKLSPQRQVIFSLSLYEGLSNQDIADQMGLQKKTVDNQLGTALRQLREELAGYVDLLIDLSLLAIIFFIFFLLGLG